MRCFSQLTPLSTEIRMEDNFPTGNHIISANQVDKTLSSLRRFDRSLPMSLLKAHESVLRMFIPHLRAHDLSPQQWRVMRALADTDALDVSELSEACFVAAAKRQSNTSEFTGEGHHFSSPLSQ